MISTLLTSDPRTVILGMNNPLSDDPRHALAPYPVNCTGWRVYKMLDDAARAAGLPPAQTAAGPAEWRISREAYKSAFDRRNVLHAREWSPAEARRAGSMICGMGGRRVVVLGVQTLSAVQLERPPWCEWRSYRGLMEDLSYCLLPHPSGRCREYNDPEFRARAGAVLLAEYMRDWS